jgi:HD superfamily phosphodiesterase
MEDRTPSNDELRLAEFLHQILDLSDDQDNAGRIIVRGPDGAYIGEATLSARDVEAVTDALISLNGARADLEEATRPAAPLPPVDADDVDAMVAELENIANGGQA